MGELIAMEMPSLVFEALIETMDENLLRLFRLVCSSWNAAASRELRLRSQITLDESEPERLRDLRTLLLNRAFSADLPSPFKNVEVIPTHFSDECFKNLIQIPNLVVTSLILTRMPQNRMRRTADGDFQKGLKSLLIEKGRQIKFLSISAAALDRYSRLDQGIPYFCNARIQLRALKHVTLVDNSPNCKHFEFYANIFHGCTLKTISLRMSDTQSLISLLTAADLHAVTKMEITAAKSLSPQDWKSLKGLELACLQSLKFSCSGTHMEEQFAGWLPNFAPKIRILESEHAKAGMLPKCPSLQILPPQDVAQINLITSHKFPSIKTITITGEAVSWRNHVHTVVVHPGVTKILVRVSGSGPDKQDIANAYMHILVSNLSKQFPGLDIIAVDIQSLYSLTFRSIYYDFPHLKLLKVASSWNFFSDSGVKMDSLNEYLLRGCRDESGFLNNSTVDRLALESLVIDSNVTVTSEAIMFCLSKIGSLKFLEFYWNGDLVPQQIRDHLGHLENVTIRSLRGSRFEEASVELKTIANVTLLSFT